MNRKKWKALIIRSAVLAAVLLLAGIHSAEVRADGQSGVGFRFDFGPGWSTMDEASSSDARWSNGALVNVEEYWDMDFKGRGGPTFGAALFYRFNPHISLELEGRGLYTEPDMTTDYTVYWDWNDGRSAWNAYRGYPYDRPSMRTMVGSLNLLAHLTDAGPVRPYLSFGFSAFDTSIRGVRDTAYAYTYTSGELQYLDFEYPLLDFGADTSTLGVNVGVGGDLMLSRQVALTFMVKYYYSEKKDVTLGVTGGNYPELRNFTMEVDPSFWITTGGIKFMF